MDRKRKLHKFFALVCCFIGVFLLLGCMISPAFAASTDGYSFALFQFDYIEYFRPDNSGSVIYPWAFNCFPASSEDFLDCRVAVEDKYYDIDISYENGNYYAGVDFNHDMNGDGLVWELHRSDMYISESDLANGTYEFNFMPASSSLVDLWVSFYLMYFDSSNGDYNQLGEYVTVSSSDVYFDLADIVYDAISARGIDTGDYYHLHDFTVTFSNVVGVDTLGLGTSTTFAIPSGYLYVNGQRLPYTEEIINTTPGDSNGFSFNWLISTVSGFLEAELWPNFTLGGMLRVVFIIGLVFLFLKFAV